MLNVAPAPTASAATPAQRLAFLQSSDGIRQVEVKYRRVAVAHLRELRAQLKRECPSSTWFQAAWENGENLPTGWILCPICERLMPPQLITARGLCHECKLDITPIGLVCRYPSSPSGQAFKAAEEAGIRLKGF